MDRKNALLGQVVVITGASCGLGREAAVQFARKGSKLILAARRKDALDETAQLCRKAGGDARCIVTDITREEDVKRLVNAALATEGRIDVWVNNAGVTMFATLAGVPFEEHRRVIEANLFGAMYAAREVIPIFRRQKRGILINIGSILSKIGQPFAPSYVISKFALRGLSEVLRAEFADEPDIHVCSLFTYAMNTQHFQSGANHLGRDTHVMPPEQSPEKVARAILSLAERPRRELHIPSIAMLGLALHAICPRTVEQLLLHALREWHFGDSAQSTTLGNLYQPSSEPAEVHGTRPPLLSTPRLFAWVALDLARIASKSSRHAAGRFRDQARAWLAPKALL